MASKLQNDMNTGSWRSSLFFGLLLLMIVSLFLPRVFLSVSMMVFILSSFIHSQQHLHWRRFFKTPLLWGMSLLFLLPFMSGLWSSDLTSWQTNMRIKLPLVFMPLAFASPFELSKTQWRLVAYVFISVIVGATAWTMFQYLRDAQVINAGYSSAKTMRTPLQNDHVRFSWLVSVTVLLVTWMGLNREWTFKYRILLYVIAGWLIVFLHILAVRTGILCLYLAIFFFSVFLLSRRGNIKYGTILLLLLFIMPVTAYYTSASFRNKMNYARYEMDFYKNDAYQPGANDIVRSASMRAGMDIFSKHIFTGVGFGDITEETNRWYDIHYPQIIPSDRILPSSGWLVYAAGCGIWGLFVFVAAMIIPFFVRATQRLLWLLLNIAVITSFISDIGLEVQFGVFIYSFLLLWWWKWFQSLPK
jgi:O-antigen ligase